MNQDDHEPPGAEGTDDLPVGDDDETVLRASDLVDGTLPGQDADPAAASLAIRMSEAREALRDGTAQPEESEVDRLVANALAALDESPSDADVPGHGARVVHHRARTRSDMRWRDHARVLAAAAIVLVVATAGLLAVRLSGSDQGGEDASSSADAGRVEQFDEDVASPDAPTEMGGDTESPLGPDATDGGEPRAASGDGTVDTTAGSPTTPDDTSDLPPGVLLGRVLGQRAASSP